MVDSAMDRVRELGIAACVFDIDECRTLSDMHEFLPQVDMFVAKTHVFAYYVDSPHICFSQQMSNNIAVR